MSSLKQFSWRVCRVVRARQVEQVLWVWTGQSSKRAWVSTQPVSCSGRRSDWSDRLVRSGFQNIGDNWSIAFACDFFFPHLKKIL
ncbi:hypothetical protein SLEP1_g12396 [Rubroshorea leprosula]|uniref:Uncharacterized protein n=1 Tax=Rubroshorea leprosula TaxID=152421 RepID=A0AAV5ICE4_9ROSI|nr:hypothetical protein SLEP1_g12396 [Rubroshorea leprosula]